VHANDADSSSAAISSKRARRQAAARQRAATNVRTGAATKSRHNRPASAVKPPEQGLKLGGLVAQWLRRWIRDREVASREFDSRRVRYQVTTLGKLFPPTYLCRCTWSSGWCRLVTFRSRFDSHRGSYASKLLTYCVLRSTQPPTVSKTGNE